MRAAALASLVALTVVARPGLAQPATAAAPPRAASAVATRFDSAIVDLAGDASDRRRPTLLARPIADVDPPVLRSNGPLVGMGPRTPADGEVVPALKFPAPAAAKSPQPVVRSQRAPQSWWPPLASAIVPGAGQGLLRQDRAIAYLAIESYGWLRYVSDVREARRQRNGYRTLAARVSRAYLSDATPVGDFEYYERMEHYVESGVFDTSPEEGVQPEVNPESFNGFIWLRARTTFWDDPASPPPPTSQPYFAALE
jgi:hypothetical protein